MTPLTDKAKNIIEELANEKYPFVWPKNKDGEEIVQRVGQKAPGSAQHRKRINQFVAFTTAALQSPDLLREIGIVQQEEAIGFAEWAFENMYRQFDSKRWGKYPVADQVYTTTELYSFYQSK